MKVRKQSRAEVHSMCTEQLTQRIKMGDVLSSPREVDHTAYFRKRSDAASPASPASSKTRAAGRASPRMGQAERIHVIPSKPTNHAGDQNSVARTKSQRASKAKQRTAQPVKPASWTTPSDTTTSKAQTLAFMKRAASIRRGRSD